MSKTKIVYRDIAPGSAEDAAVTVTAADGVSTPALLPFGGEGQRIATLEHNLWLGDGSFALLDGQEIPYWSAAISEPDGFLHDDGPIVMTFARQYTSMGITLRFDDAMGEWADRLQIDWYRGEDCISSKSFAPNAVEYFCDNPVEAFDKIIINLLSTNIPQRRARLTKILIGIIRTFTMGEIRDARITAETSLISAEMPVDKLNWTLDSRDDVDYMFQLKQPVEVYTDDSLIGVYYIDKASRQAGSIYKIDCHDALGVLDEIPFAGGVYNNYSARQLCRDIVGGDFDLAFDKADTTLTGIIQPGTKRQALQQVLFAWGACLSTYGGAVIRIFDVDDTLTEIDQDNAYSGPTVETAAIVTQVQVTAHTYTETENGSIVIGGTAYSDTESVYTVSNPNVTANDKANVIQVDGATLVSSDIGQAVAQRIYDYYTKRKTVRGKIVWSGELPGDYISIPNVWGGATAGNIAKMEITLSNTIAAQTELRGE